MRDREVDFEISGPDLLRLCRPARRLLGTSRRSSDTTGGAGSSPKSIGGLDVEGAFGEGEGRQPQGDVIDHGGIGSRQPVERAEGPPGRVIVRADLVSRRNRPGVVIPKKLQEVVKSSQAHLEQRRKKRTGDTVFARQRNPCRRKTSFSSDVMASRYAPRSRAAGNRRLEEEHRHCARMGQMVTSGVRTCHVLLRRHHRNRTSRRAHGHIIPNADRGEDVSASVVSRAQG